MIDLGDLPVLIDKSASSKFLLFGDTLKKARQFILKYRKSPKAKSLLLQWFPRKLPGYVITRWYTFTKIYISFYLKLFFNGII